MVEDKLKVNEEKTEFLIIGTRQQLIKVRYLKGLGHAILGNFV